MFTAKSLSRSQGLTVVRFLLLTVLLLVVAGVFLFQRYVAPQVGDFRVMLNAIAGTGIDTPQETTLKETLTIDDRLELRIFAADLPNARWLQVTRKDDVLVSRPRKGDIVLLKADADGDGRSDGRETLVAELNMPHGIELVDGWLYVAEQDAIGRVRFNADTGMAEGPYQRLLSGLPGGGNHWAKNLAMGPDGWLYFNVGSSCNVCIEEDQRRGTLMRVKPDGGEAHIYATGLRNSTGFDWAPWNKALYAGDISRDLLGDDYPVDELNLIVENGFYGWPYVNDFGDEDPDFGDRLPAGKSAIEPVLGIPAHTTPLGLHFLQHETLQQAFSRSALMALHGSWNRSVPDGYRLELLQWDADDRLTSKTLLDGFWTGSGIIGRPVDIEEDSNGHIYLSDDYAGAVYRLQLKPGE
ncbi:MAG TPA: oxidoreductase [Spongiibacteraceae bacterium]|nr:oxidoreductase [Spongiibacteraceae bacterium]HCS26936.1 oxidoreductase [Spongiibacteraceae bacterium]|tara:strand:- start:2568 stop:3800 length:1233 start_codon:yes stop_codon:yes gene_type:complete